MTIDTNGIFKSYRLALRFILVTLICFTLIATPVFSMSPADKQLLNDNTENIGCSSSNGCIVNITKPATATGYLFDEFEFPLLLITLPIIFGGITCKAEVNASTEEPDYIQWKFANFLGDEFRSYPIDYQPGITKYQYYMGRVNLGQFKVWIYCYDSNNQVICEDTIGCFKIF